MARTFGRHETTPTRGKYPARCDLCGVVWKAQDLFRRADGFFVCPDDRDERGGYALDRANARYRSRGVVDSRGPYDPPEADETIL
jgi:hypothetical protein